MKLSHPLIFLQCTNIICPSAPVWYNRQSIQSLSNGQQTREEVVLHNRHQLGRQRRRAQFWFCKTGCASKSKSSSWSLNGGSAAIHQDSSVSVHKLAVQTLPSYCCKHCNHCNYCNYCNYCNHCNHCNNCNHCNHCNYCKLYYCTAMMIALLCCITVKLLVVQTLVL